MAQTLLAVPEISSTVEKTPVQLAYDLDGSVLRTRIHTKPTATTMQSDSDQAKPQAPHPKRNPRQEAALQVFLKYQRRMAMLVRRRLSQQIRSDAGGTDAIVQSAWKTFDKAATQLVEPDEFLKKLFKATSNKAKAALKRARTKKRDIRRKVPLSPGTRSDQDLPDLDFFASDPMPDEVAMFQEMLESLTPEEQVLVWGLLYGRTYQEIGEEFKCSKSEIGRRVQALREKLSKWLN
jgi:RNA polymerase sigma factor (sigma-70 family)